MVGAPSADLEQVISLLADNVMKHPGQRGEHIAAGLATDTKALRSPTKQLIEADQIKPKGERRGVQYWEA